MRMTEIKPRGMKNDLTVNDNGMPTIYRVIIHANEDFPGFWAECVSLPGTFTDGDSVEEIKENMYESVSLTLKTDYPHVTDYSLVFDIAE